MKITRFEDIQAWQEARKLTNMVYEVTGSGKFNKDFGLSNQIQRSAVSVMANIAEGFDRKTPKEFLNFLSYASASASEVKSHLYVALDRKYLSSQTFDEIYGQANTVANLIHGFIKYLKNR